MDCNILDANKRKCKSMVKFVQEWRGNLSIQEIILAIVLILFY